MTDEKRAYDQMTDLGPVERGPIPRPCDWPRWVRVEQADLTTLPPVKSWTCLRTPEPPVIDGRLDDAVWGRVPWSEPFGMIDTGGPTPLETRVAMLWDDDFLYVGYRVEDPDIRAVQSGFNAHVYRTDEDVEFFFAGPDHYFEIGLNPLNNSYQIRWTWVETLVREQRFDELEALFRTPDVLYYVAREGERMGRHADMSYRMPGLRHAVHVDGSLNAPWARDRGWTVEMAIPWSGLAEISTSRPLPPKPGDMFRMTAYRCHHDREARRAKGWTWSVQGNDNVHIPERWNEIVFSGDEA